MCKFLGVQRASAKIVHALDYAHLQPPVIMRVLTERTQVSGPDRW